MMPSAVWRERPLAIVTGVLLTLGVLYFVAEFASASLWSGGVYSFRENFVSDLGVTVCRDIAGSFVCSPGNAIMNTGFIVQGVVIGIGGVLASHLLLSHRRVRFVVMALLVLSAVGTILVGLFHGSFGLPSTGLNRIHRLGALLAIVAGNAGILVFAGAAMKHGPRRWASFGILAGTVGLASLLLFRTPVENILGSGTVERLAVNPIILWTIATGILLIWGGLHRRTTPVPDRAREFATADQRETS